MTAETIIKTIDRICGTKYAYQIIQSKTTNSIYCTVQNGNAMISFRVSDHSKKMTGVRSFIFHKGTRVISLERFINNTIKKLQIKSLYITLARMSTTVEYA